MQVPNAQRVRVCASKAESCTQCEDWDDNLDVFVLLQAERRQPFVEGSTEGDHASRVRG